MNDSNTEFEKWLLYEVYIKQTTLEAIAVNTKRSHPDLSARLRKAIKKFARPYLEAHLTPVDWKHSWVLDDNMREMIYDRVASKKAQRVTHDK